VFTIEADRSPLKRELSAAKQEVTQAMREIKAQARTTLNAPNELGNLAPSVSTQVASRIAQAERITRNRLERQRVNTLARRELASRGLDPSAILGRDRDQEAFDREIAARRARRAARFESHLEGLRLRSDPMSDAARMRGGMPVAGPSGGTSFMGGPGGSYLAGAAIAATVVMAKKTLDVILQQRVIQNYITGESGRIGGVQNRLAGMGLSAEAGLQGYAQRSLRARAAVDRFGAIQSAFPSIGFTYDAITGRGAKLRLTAEQAEREQAIAEGAVGRMGDYRVRAAMFNNGAPVDSLFVNRARRAEELRQHRALRANIIGGSPELDRAGAALRDAQAREDEADVVAFNSRRRSLSLESRGLALEGRGIESRLRGTGREEFVFERAGALNNLRRGFLDRLASAPESERATIMGQFRTAETNFRAETEFMNRMRAENPGGAMGISSREAAGPYQDPTFLAQNTTNQILASILQAISGNSLN